MGKENKNACCPCSEFDHSVEEKLKINSLWKIDEKPNTQEEFRAIINGKLRLQKKYIIHFVHYAGLIEMGYNLL